jgi:LytS/YehU family sensor histidine kinase
LCYLSDAVNALSRKCFSLWSQSITPCYIRLSAILEQQTLKFSIENSNFAVGREGLGTGLKQVQERLKLEYNNQNVFHIQKNDKTFSVQLKLNLGN